nr:hypothetical protein [Kofleriaceae bacterium]
IALVVPSLIVLARSRFYAPFRLAVAAIGAVASTAWILERAAGIATPIPALVERAAHHGLAIVLGLAALAAIAAALPLFAVPAKEQLT